MAQEETLVDVVLEFFDVYYLEHECLGRSSDCRLCQALNKLGEAVKEECK